MRKRLISVCIIGVLICGIYKYVQIAEAPIAKPVIALDYTEERVRLSAQTETEDEILSSPEPVQPEPAQRQWQVYIQPDMPGPFIEVLKQYEEFMNTDIQILNDDAWWVEFNTVDGERGDLLWDVCGNLMSLLKDPAEESDIESYRYSLTDLTGDGFPELIMGRYFDLFDETWLYVVYYYSETEGIKMEYWSSYFNMSLYEDGIIEYISGGMDYTITYLRFQEETESWELADRIIVDWDSQDDSESYYRGVNTADFSDPANEPMSEEEYREIVERYTAEPVELEWTPMFGGETPDEKADSKNDEPVTVITKKTIYIDGSIDGWNEYEYDNAGNMIKDTRYFGSDGSLWNEYEYEYDSKGNLTKETYYGADGDIDGWNEYEYDNAGNQTKKIWSVPNGKSHVLWEKGYDSTGNETKRISYGYDGSVYKDEYEYDSVGNKTKWVGYDKDGNIDDWYEYEYDSSGNLTKDTRYHSDGSIWYWLEYEYDSAGNQIKMTSYSSDGSIESWEEYEYDSAGYETKYTVWDCEIGIEYWREYEYDGVDTGDRIKKFYHDSNGTISEHEYDSAGNHTKHILYDNDLIISGYEWEYDSMGNLTKHTYTTTYQGYTALVEYEYITITPQ